MSRLVVGVGLGSEETALEGFGSGRMEGVASCRPSSFPKTIPIAQMRDAARGAFPSTAVEDGFNSVVAEVI